MRHILLFIYYSFHTIITQAQLPNVYIGKIERVDSFYSKFVQARTVDVWLPENYSTNKKYAVLYMHDGQMLFDSTKTWNKQEWNVDETTSSLISQNFIKSCIVVGIWNTGKLRHSDYFPTKVVNALPNALRDSIINDELQGKSRADDYLKFIVKELKPFIDKKYSTWKNAENTLIAGSSMGGLISLYAICEYPNVFGKAACISTHWIGSSKRLYAGISKEFIVYLKQNAPSPKNHVLYFDYGMKGLDALYKIHQVKVNEILQHVGYNNKNLLVKEFAEHNHNEKAWSERLHIPLQFLLGK
jgi:predicted alpha/beta superfamily hydrolase